MSILIIKRINIINTRLIVFLCNFFVMVMSSCILCAQTEFESSLYDSNRNRIVPIMVYEPLKVDSQTRVVFFSHGYNANKKGAFKDYSSLLRPLARKGCYVVSIQHELSDDPLLSMHGTYMQTRMPTWIRGMENLKFVYDTMKHFKPELNWGKLVMLGHSNGGDMTMLFADKYPKLLDKAVSLDHLRMIIPRTDSPKIYSLRASNTKADDGVIPSKIEQEKYKIDIVQLEKINHGDMDNKGTESQQKIILNHIYRILNEK